MVFLISKRQGRKEIAAWKKEPPQPNTKLFAGAIPSEGDIPISHWVGIYGGGIQRLGRKETHPAPLSSLEPQFFEASIFWSAFEKQTPGKKQVGEKPKILWTSF